MAYFIFHIDNAQYYYYYYYKNGQATSPHVYIFTEIYV